VGEDGSFEVSRVRSCGRKRNDLESYRWNDILDRVYEIVRMKERDVKYSSVDDRSHRVKAEKRGQDETTGGKERLEKIHQDNAWTLSLRTLGNRN
jgi:hypothetical protein